MFNRSEFSKYEITHRISSPKIRRCQGPPKHIATVGTKRTGVDCLRAWHCCATLKPVMNCISFSENEAEMPTCVQGLPYYTNSSCGHWCTCGIVNRAILSHRQTGLIQIDVAQGNICRTGWRSAPISWAEKDLHPPVASLERPVLIQHFQSRKRRSLSTWMKWSAVCARDHPSPNASTSDLI